MTKDKALFSWFNTFAKTEALGCYADTAVPEVATLPYITYTYQTSEMGSPQVPCTVNIWKKTTSEADMNELAERFRKYVKANRCVETDEGLLFIWPGSPFAISQNSQEDRSIKLRYINLSIDYCTE